MCFQDVKLHNLPFPKLDWKHSDYVDGKVLGSGAFGEVKLVTHKETGKRYALKVIKKAPRGARTHAREKASIEKSFHDETRMLELAQGPGILALAASGHDSENFYILLGMLEGGDLFDRIVEEPPRSERDIASWARQLIQPLAIVHERKMAHRDIKPENYAFASKDDDNTLTLIDFGCAISLDDQKTIFGSIQSPYYYAPETVKKTSSPINLSGEMWRAADMWSIGVVIFLFCYLRPPFAQAHSADQERAILNAAYEFDSTENVSDDAKDLISKLLVVDWKQRLTAQEALLHPWFESADPGKALSTAGINNLIKFAHQQNQQNQMRKEVAHAMVGVISRAERELIQKTFETFDINKNGVLEATEVTKMLESLQHTSEDDVKHIVNLIDGDESGTVSLEEFTAAVLAGRLSTAGELEMKEMFRLADTSGDGLLSLQELIELFPNLSAAKVTSLFREADTANSNSISFDEWVKVLQK
jgi:calcium-dependent protein kinase